MTTQLIILTRKRPSADADWVNMFLAKDTTTPAETLLRKAIADYLKTPDGIADAKHTNFDFNWGDAIYMPQSAWAKHNIVCLEEDEAFTCAEPMIPVHVTVNQDELLYPDMEV